jgi:hypothetical protein
MWIDAICIDQNNEQERSEQVQRMGQIFLLASRVVAWLGPSFPGSCLALRTLARIGWQVELTKDNYLLPTPQCSHPDWVKFETRLPVGANELAALSQLCGLEYFERLWVIQELHLASARSVVRCGNDGIPWPLFRREILCILAKEQETTRTRCHVIRVANMSRWFQNIPMHKIIYLCRHRKCVDDRDRVYAVMNLLHPAVSKCIVVDYSRPAIDAFKQVFLVFLGQEQRLTQLKYARLRHLPRSSKTSSLSSEVWPTWLPNWSKHIRLTAPLEMTFSASGISAARAKNMPPGRLEITGLCFATVSIVHPPLRSSSKVLTDIVEMLNGLGLEQLQSSKYTTGETLLDVYLCTIVGGSIKDRVPGLPFPRLTELRDEVTSLAIHTESPEESKLPEFYRFKVRDQTVGACIFEMLNGYVGVLIGNPRPGKHTYRIITQAY